MGVLDSSLLKVGAIFWVAAQVHALAQVAHNSATSADSSIQTAVQAYQEEQQSLMQQERTLMAQGATPDQLQAWRQQNAATFADLQQKAEIMSANSYLEERPANIQPIIPVGASQILRDFFTTRANLVNAQAVIHNQIVEQLSASGQSVTVDQIKEAEKSEIALFRQQYSADLQLQQQRAQELATITPAAPIQVLPLRIPSDASPQLTAYLTARNQLMQAYAQVWNQNLNADPATRETVMEQWRQQNSGSFQQLPQLAQALSQSQEAATNEKASTAAGD